MVKAGKITRDIALALAMFDPTQRLIIKDHIHNRNIFFDCGHEAIHANRKPTIAAYGNNLTFGVYQLGGQRSWRGIPHGTYPSRLQKRTWGFGLEVVHHEQPVLACIARDNGI